MNSTDYNFRPKDALLGAQMLFVAFGALVLVPILTGLNPNVALFTAGLGTLVFQVITGGKVPVFLASSFAFIAPIIHGVKTWGIPGTLAGLVAAGILYMLLSLLIQIKGTDFLHRLMPPVVIGPVIMTIGLILAPVGVFMAMGKTGDGAIVLVPFNQAIVISMLALVSTIVTALLGRGMIKLIPILVGITVGYIASLVFGVVDFGAVSKAAWIAVPDFTMPEWNLEAIIYIVPIAIAPAIEHVGDMLAISSVTKKDYLESPGLHRTLLGDGVATSLAGLFGGPPNTTYGEVTGAVTLTKAFNPAIMTWAAIVAIVLAFVGKLGAILATIPVPVMGGIMILLFGAIMVIGMNTLVKSGDDLTEPRNMIIVAVVMVFGVGGMQFQAGNFTLQGIGLAAVSAIILNLILPKAKS
jgi:uracil permease